MSNYRLKFGVQWGDLSEELPYIFNLKNRFKHTYIIGKTGTGKSTLMFNMALQDIKHGLAVIFIDPKGDKAKLLENAADPDKLIKISYTSPLRINPLRKSGYHLANTINEFVEILDILITKTSSNPESTVLMREIIDKAIKAFMPSQRQIDYLCTFLMFEPTRKKHFETFIADKFRVPDMIRFYWQEFDQREGRIPKNREKLESAKRVASRLDRLISDERMRKIVTGENQLDIGEIAREGKILLVDTSKMDDFNRIYLSNLITHAVKSHCEFIGNEHPLMVYVDEFQLCFSPLFSHLFATARDQKVGFVLAHQNMEQIDQKTLGSILGNFHTFVCFRCGDTEANKMARVYGLPYENFINLKDYQAHLRMGNKNIHILTDPPPKITPRQPRYNFLRAGWIDG